VGYLKVSSFSWQNFVPLSAGFPLERGRQRGVLPLKDAILTLLALLVWKRLQIGTHTLFIITSTGDMLIKFINIDDLEQPWTPKRGVLVNFSQVLDALHISTLNCDEMAEDRPRQHAHKIFSIQRSPDPLRSRRPAQAGVKDGYPFKKWLFYSSYLV